MEIVACNVSPRERDVLVLMERGCSYAETATALGVAVSTVQSHMKSLYSKLAVHSKTEAIFEARQAGLI
jgi:DNA-binding CsgD family transcriptional regulator